MSITYQLLRHLLSKVKVAWSSTRIFSFSRLREQRLLYRKISPPRWVQPTLGLYVSLQSTGILQISFDPMKSMNESLSVIGINTDAGFMPGWLPSFNDRIYRISRASYLGSDTQSGDVFAFQRMPGTASATSGTGLTFLNQASSNGKGLSRGTWQTSSNVCPFQYK